MLDRAAEELQPGRIELVGPGTDPLRPLDRQLDRNTATEGVAGHEDGMLHLQHVQQSTDPVPVLALTGTSLAARNWVVKATILDCCCRFIMPQPVMTTTAIAAMELEKIREV